jgi:hypothetical protein
MRALLAGLAVALVITGCSTPKKVATLEGRGTRQVFDASFTSVWRAAVDAAQQGELEIMNADRVRGYISARRTVQMETFGENVGVWVRSLNPTRTEVEVVSRQAGPPVMWLRNWENEIMRAIAANLTREAVGGVGTGSTTIVVPEANRERTTIVLPESSAATETRLRELRDAERARELELQRELSTARREEIRAEIERLRRELREQEQRLLDLERQVR